MIFLFFRFFQIIGQTRAARPPSMEGAGRELGGAGGGVGCRGWVGGMGRPKREFYKVPPTRPPTHERGR